MAKEEKKYPLRKKSSPCCIKEAPGMYERALCALWASLPENSVLELENSAKCTVLFPGVANSGDGPDFLRAKLRFGRKVKVGDIAIHCRVSDFIRHKHIADPAYSNVILQAAQLNDLKSIPPRFLARLPLFLINEEKIELIRKQFIEDAPQKTVPGIKIENIRKEIRVPAETVKETLAENCSGKIEERITVKNTGKNTAEKAPEYCIALCPFLASLSDADKERKFFLNAAKESLTVKAEEILRKMISCGTENAFKEQLFLFAGQRENAKSFAALFVTYSHYNIPVRQKYFASILWGESGLLPDPSSSGLPEENVPYIKELWQEYWQNRSGNKVSPSWKRTGTLFGNTPERSLALLCVLLRKLPFDPLPFLAGSLLEKGPEEFEKYLWELLEIREPFWEWHNSFLAGKNKTKRTLFSPSKKIRFCTEVLTPCLIAYGRLKKDFALLQSLEKFFLLLKSPESNSSVRKASQFWYNGKKLPSSASEYLGWQYIYEKYCQTLSHDCENCILAGP